MGSIKKTVFGDLEDRYTDILCSTGDENWFSYMDLFCSWHKDNPFNDPDDPSDEELNLDLKNNWQCVEGEQENQMLQRRHNSGIVERRWNQKEIDVVLLNKKMLDLRHKAVTEICNHYGITGLDVGSIVQSDCFDQIKQDMSNLSFTFLSFIGFSGFDNVHSSLVAKKLFSFAGLKLSSLGEGCWVLSEIDQSSEICMSALIKSWDEENCLLFLLEQSKQNKDNSSNRHVFLSAEKTELGDYRTPIYVEIGHQINKIGGLAAMKRVCKKIYESSRSRHYSCWSDHRELSMCWHGIGGWQD